MATIAAVVRWADNTSQLATNLEQGLNQIEAMTRSADKLARSLSTDSLKAAHNWAAAIEKIGGVEHLTTAERERANRALQEALEKYQALGKQAPIEIVKLGDSLKQMDGASAGSGKRIGTLSQQFREFDNVLGAAGLQITSEIRALRDLEEAASASAGQLGTLVTIGLTAGAAFAGWKIGRVIADFTGSDKAIGDATARLLGWTTAAGGAGSASEALARASAIAGRQVLSLADAIRINTEAVRQQQGELSRSTAIEQSAKQVAGWRAELDKVRASGVLPGLQHDLESHNFSQAELARRYGISTEALALLDRQMQKHHELQQRISAAHEKELALQDHLYGRDLAARAQEYIHALGDVDNVTKATREAQAEMNKVFGGAYDALVKAGQGASETAKQFAMLRDLTTDWVALNAKIAAAPNPFEKILRGQAQAFRDQQMAIMDENQGITDNQLFWAHAGEIADAAMAQTETAVGKVTAKVEQATAAVKAMQGAFSIGASDAAQLDADAEKNLRRGGIASTVGMLQRQAAMRIRNGLPSFATGVENFVGGDAIVGERGPEIVRLPRGSSVIPNGGGGTVVVHAPITITGGGARAGREAADALIQRMKQAGIRVH